MKKRILSFLTIALLLFPLLSSSALTPCEHYPGQVADYELEELNRIDPQTGIDGSVDLACPICHQIVDSVILPALPAPAEHPAASDSESPQISESAVQPEEQPSLPEQKPEEQPAQSKQKQEEQPAQPEKPTQSEKAAQSETLAQPETQAQPLLPMPPEAPVLQSGDTTQVTAPQVRDADPAPETSLPTAKETRGKLKPDPTSTPTQSDSSTSTRSRTVPQNGTAPEEVSGWTTFPFRRMKMKPKLNIRAEAAGELLWPLYGTPFQMLYND